MERQHDESIRLLLADDQEMVPVSYTHLRRWYARGSVWFWTPNPT